MARDMGLPFAPPTEGFQMPEPPGSTGYDFISGHAACSAADVEALPRTDEWWLVATKEMDDSPTRVKPRACVRTPGRRNRSIVWRE